MAIGSRGGYLEIDAPVRPGSVIVRHGIGQKVRLRRQVAQLVPDKEIVKGRGLLRARDGAVNRRQAYEFIAADKTIYPVRLLSW
jgi:hypothetical protein